MNGRELKIIRIARGIIWTAAIIAVLHMPVIIFNFWIGNTAIAIFGVGSTVFMIVTVFLMRMMLKTYLKNQEVWEATKKAYLHHQDVSGSQRVLRYYHR